MAALDGMRAQSASWPGNHRRRRRSWHVAKPPALTGVSGNIELADERGVND